MTSDYQLNILHLSDYTQVPNPKSDQVYAPVSTSGSMLPTRVVERATLKSYTRCKLSENSGVAPRAHPMRSAESHLVTAHHQNMSRARIEINVIPAQTTFRTSSKTTKNHNHSPSFNITAIIVQISTFQTSFILRQKLILPRNCLLRGKFVLNSTSN